MKFTQETLLNLAVHLMYMTTWACAMTILHIWETTTTPLWMSLVFAMFTYIASALIRTFAPHPMILVAGQTILAALLIGYEKIPLPILLVDYHVGNFSLFFSILIIAFALYGGIIDWKLNYQSKPYDDKYFLIIGPIILYIYSSYLNIKQYTTAAVAMAVLLILLHLWCVYLQGITNYLVQNRDVTNLPKDSILSHNNRIMSVLLVGSSIILLLACFMQFDDFFLNIGKLIIQGISFLILKFIGLIAYLLSFFPSEDVTSMVRSQAELYEQFLTQNQTSSFLLILCMIIGYLSIAYILFLFGRGLVRFFRKEELSSIASTDFVPNRQHIDKIESLAKNRSKDPKPQNEVERIRYEFKKRIEKEYKHKVPKEKTPRELTAPIMARHHDTKLNNLTKQYEEVRYHQNPDTK